MVSLTRIYTKTGDDGCTSLVGGVRVAKDSMRMQAIGAVDETNAAIGIARLHASKDTDVMLARIQHDLFDLGADLATPEHNDGDLRIVSEQVERLEQEIDEVNAKLEPLKSFVLPGGSACAAHLHLARSITRRAESVSFSLASEDTINPELLKYLNRLSDHLFVLARAENQGEDVLWQAGVNR